MHDIFRPGRPNALTALKSWLGRWWSLVIVVAAVAYVTAFQPYDNGPPIRSDGEGYHIWTRALLEGDLSFRKYKTVPGIYLADPNRDVYQNKYPPGVALIRLPVMAFLVDRRPGAPLISPAEHWANLVLSGLALAVVCFLCLRTAWLLSLPPWPTHVALLTLIFGTGLFHYGTYDACFSHIYSAMGTALLIWLGVRTVVHRRAYLPALATGVACFLFLLIRNTNVILLAALAAAYFHARRRQGVFAPRSALRDLAVMGSGSAAAVAMQLGYNAFAHGALVFSSYGSESFAWDRPMQFAVLLSYNRGLFTYYPIVALVLACAWAVGRTRWAAFWFSLAMFAYVTLYGFWSGWDLGGGFGHRGFVELMPSGIVLFAAALSAQSQRQRIAISGCALVCTLATLQFMWAYWHGSLSYYGATYEVYWDLVCGRKSFLWFLY
jgi:hypothetical protein